MNIKNNNEWEVMTPSGWKDFSAVSKSKVPVHIKIQFNSGLILLCSPTHKIKMESGAFIDAIDIQVNDVINNMQVMSVDIVHEELDVFDLKGVDGEEYITDGITSHNCAFIDNADTIWTAASSTLSTGGKAILISTPNGVGNFFHKMWLQSEEGISNFNPILLDWKVHPDRDQAWRDRQTEILGEAEAAQEHDASFIFSGNTVVKPEILEFYKKTYVTEPIKKEGFDGNLWIWEYPKENKTYILAGDVARGDGDDFSAFHIIDAESSVQVAEYKGKIPPKEFGNLMVVTATMYNDALLIADNSTIGFASLQQVIDRQYKNLFYMSKDLQVVDVLTSNYRYNKRDMVPGFTISSRTRPLIIAKLDEYMRQNSIILRSTRMLSELETFIWKNGRAEALSNYHDDLTMALAIGLWVRDTALRIHQDQLELTKQGLNATHVQYTPFVVNNGVQHNPYQMQVGETTEDIRWLLG